MLKKMFLVLGIFGLFFGFVFSKKINAAASCQCNGNWCETNFGDLGVNGGEWPEAISVNNCPSKVNLFNLNGTSLQNNNVVNPFCKKNTGGLWACQCQADNFGFDIAAGNGDYYAEYIDKVTGLSVSTKKSAGPTNCSSGGNCCVCNDTNNPIASTNNCNSGSFPLCNPNIINWSGTSTNCSCGGKALAGFNYNTYDPLCSDKTSIRTDFGCVPIGMKEFVPWLLGLVFGIAGGIAFLLMAYGFILIATSGGDEKKIQGAKETITSAIVGLLVCIFSIFILRLIAVNILQIPGIN